MQKINVEFIIKLDKEVYLDSPWKTREEFFNKLVFSHVASDYHFIANLANQQIKGQEKEKYIPYLETLKNIKDSLLQSAQYELIKEEGNIEEIKVSCHFDYHDNTINSYEETVKINIFTSNIRSSYFLAKDIVRLASIQNINPEDKLVQSAIKMYNHVGDLLNESQEKVKLSILK